MTLSQEDLNEGRALREQATPGPWDAEHDYGDESEANAKSIAWWGTHGTDLLDDNEQLRGALEALLEAIDVSPNGRDWQDVAPEYATARDVLAGGA